MISRWSMCTSTTRNQESILVVVFLKVIRLETDKTHHILILTCKSEHVWKAQDSEKNVNDFSTDAQNVIDKESIKQRNKWTQNFTAISVSFNPIIGPKFKGCIGLKPSILYCLIYMPFKPTMHSLLLMNTNTEKETG